MDEKPLMAVVSREPDYVIFDLRPVGGEARVRRDLGVSPLFSERMVMEFRQGLMDGVTMVNSTGIGLNRTGSAWRSLARSGSEEEQSILFHATRLELALTKELTVRVSTQLTRDVDHLGRVREDWSSGAVLVLTPFAETTLNAGVFRNERLDAPYSSNIFTAGLDSRLGHTPLTISLSGWSAVGNERTSDGLEFSGAGVGGMLSCQWTSMLWMAAGVQSEASDGWGASYESRRYFLSAVLKLSAEVKIGVEVSHMLGSYENALDEADAELEMTSVRVSHWHQVTGNFSTEMSVEVGVGNEETKAFAEVPLVRLAGQFSF